MRPIILATLLPALIALTASADDQQKAIKRESEKLNDQTFIAKAAIGGMFEVQSGVIAKTKAGNSAVKDFAALMVADHTKINKQLSDLASRKQWALPKELDAKHKELIATLEKSEISPAGGGRAQGSVSDRFDRTYMDMQIAEHDDAVALFENAIHYVQDPELKAWATKTLPVIREHQTMAAGLSTRRTPPAKANTSPPS